MTNNKKGFTLIELLVVIAIIGILSAIGLVSLNGAREKARDSKRQSDISSLRTALELWKDDQTGALIGTYPAQNLNTVASLVSASLTTLVPNYVAVLPITPLAGAGSMNDYWYFTNAAAITGSAVVGTYAINGAFAISTRLEGSTRLWYVVNNVGGGNATGSAGIASPTDAAGVIQTCDASVAGIRFLHVCLNAPTYTAA